MGQLHKSLVTDDKNRPIAVQIDYADWVAIEECLGEIECKTPKVCDLSHHSGTLTLSEDPVKYQAKIRGEWP